MEYALRSVTVRAMKRNHPEETMQSDISAARLEGAEADPSLNNRVRAGLQPRYDRQNWVRHSGGSV
jgi:hypothetical protein